MGHDCLCFEKGDTKPPIYRDSLKTTVSLPKLNSVIIYRGAASLTAVRGDEAEILDLARDEEGKS
jgi:hypothetical protein